MRHLKKLIEEKDKTLLIDERNVGVEKVLLKNERALADFEVCTDASIFDLYHTYDFSGKIVSIENSVSYGSLFNYVKTGILTEEEMIDALIN